MMDNSIFQKVIGMTVKEADAYLEDKGYFVRVTRCNGEWLIVTLEYRLDRLNVGTDSLGKIVEVYKVG